MNIKELEQLLDIPRANIRFYEKEGLLKPARRGNGYREYSEADVAQLQKIIVLRKIGISIADIKQILAGELPLQQAVQTQISSLAQSMEEMKNCLTFCRQIEADGIDIDNLDEAYLREIRARERDGQTFFDFKENYLDFTLDVMDNAWRGPFLINVKKFREKYGLKGCVIAIIVLCTIRGIAGLLSPERNFWRGFSYPLILFIIISAIMLPIYLISKKNRKVASNIFMVLWICCIVFLAVILIALLVLILNSWLHFLF